MSSTGPTDARDPIGVAVALLRERGYERVTVEELAGAMGMSRSTFFRRFGSKDDVVFADHELVLEHIGRELGRSSGHPLEAVAASGLIVLEHHLSDRNRATARSELLQSVPALRDREIVTSHRYEQLFVDHLRTALPDSEFRELGSLAYAAGVVAVHNAVLREWLRDATLEPTSKLETALRSLRDVFEPSLLGGRTVGGRRVVVTVFDEAASADEVSASVRDALGEAR